MATVEEKIWAALEARVASLVTVPALPIAWPDNDFSQPPPYLRVSYFPNQNERILIRSDGPSYRQGILQLTVVAPLRAGPVPALSWAGQIAAHFPADLQMHREGIILRVQKTPNPRQADKTDVSNDIAVDVYYETFA